MSDVVVSSLLNTLSVLLPLLIAGLLAKPAIARFTEGVDRKAVAEALANGAKAALAPMLTKSLAGTPTVSPDTVAPVLTPESIAQYGQEMVAGPIKRLNVDPRALLVKSAAAITDQTIAATAQGLLQVSPADPQPSATLPDPPEYPAAARSSRL